MSKKNTDTPRGVPSPSFSRTMVIHDYEIQSIEGKLLTIVESLGLPEKQENATKSLVRQAIWDNMYPPYRLFIFGDTMFRMIEKENKERSVGQAATPR